MHGVVAVVLLQLRDAEIGGLAVHRDGDFPVAADELDVVAGVTRESPHVEAGRDDAPEVAALARRD